MAKTRKPWSSDRQVISHGASGARAHVSPAQAPKATSPLRASRLPNGEILEGRSVGCWERCRPVGSAAMSPATR